MNKANGGLDLIGKRFGRLVVQSIIRRNTQGAAVYLCVCDCGGTCTPGRQNLRHGESKSCGCLRKEVTRKNMTRHGLADTRVHRIWKNILTRCGNSHTPSYKDYGGRGIKVCARWQTFENFLTDMGQPPTVRHSIDRIDVNGDYRPGNCRWATDKEQALNKRNSRIVHAFGKAMTVDEWSSRVTIPERTLRSRLGRGWKPEDALTIPKGGKPRKGLQGTKSPKTTMTDAQVLTARAERKRGVHYLTTMKNLGITRGQYWSAILCWKHL